MKTKCTIFLMALLLTTGKFYATQGFDKQVNCLLTDTVNNVLYAGGLFTTVDGVTVNGVAKWDGTSWSAMGSGLTDGPYASGMGTMVYSLVMHNGELYAGGDFTKSGSTTVNKIAKWNGTAWVAVGTGMSTTGTYDAVCSMTVFGNELYTGGLFSSAGGVTVKNIAKYNGTSWSNVAGGIYDRVNSLFVHDAELYAGGIFFLNNTTFDLQYRIAKLSGTSWLNVGAPGVGDANNQYDVRAMTNYNGDMYAGGYFDDVDDGATEANHIAKWSSSAWSTLGTGANAGVNGGTSTTPINALVEYDNKLYVGGYYTAAGGTTANNIAAWDGTSWSTAGSGVGGSISAMAVYNGKLVVGGNFVTAGGSATNRFAVWDGTSWSSAVNIVEKTASGIDVALTPNPCNNSAVFTLDSKTPLQQLELTIFDLPGREVSKVTTQNENKIRFERNDLPSGMYLYTIRNNGNTIAAGKLIME